MTGRTYNVLFLCTHNSCRSVIAECILNALGAPAFRAFSAGSQPSGLINPGALALLARHGYSTDGVRSKSWDAFAAPAAPGINFIFTVCDDAASEICPVWPGHPTTAHWGVEDPSRVKGTDAERHAAFEACHDILRRRIEAFLALEFELLDRDAIAARARDIGLLS